eukprot:13544956-Heterocapsa_arctica.AAC.1
MTGVCPDTSSTSSSLPLALRLPYLARHAIQLVIFLTCRRPVYGLCCPGGYNSSSLPMAPR